jgi:hypothetical protein
MVLVMRWGISARLGWHYLGTVARPGFPGYAFVEDALNLAKGCFTLFTASKRLFRAKRLRRSDPDIRLESQEKEQIPAFMGWVTRRVPRSDSYPA